MVVLKVRARVGARVRFIKRVSFRLRVRFGLSTSLTMLWQKRSGRDGASSGRKCCPGRSARPKKSGKRGATAMTGDPLASLCLKLVAHAPLSRYTLYLHQSV